MTKEYGLIGHPLGHSFSAHFFAKKFKLEKIDAVYHNFDLPKIEQFKEVVATHPMLQGFNVTIPYKESIIPLLDDLSDEAKAIGAVNVVRVLKDGNNTPTYLGYNTDIVGFCNSIAPLLCPHHQRALILGTGGASKAITYGLKKMGISTVYVSRTPQEGMLSYQQIDASVLATHTIIVNCSPVGMYPKCHEAPELPYELLTPRHLCYDLVYNPEDTEFMKRSRLHGAMVKNGLEMLHLQAIAAWEIWNNL